MWIARALHGKLKGKRKGKGFQGGYYNCGETGHPARDCPRGGKAKGKGKSYKVKGKGS